MVEYIPETRKECSLYCSILTLYCFQLEGWEHKRESTLFHSDFSARDKNRTKTKTKTKKTADAVR